MIDLKPGWQKRVSEQAAETLRNLPDSAKPKRERPTYVPPAERTTP